MEVFSKGKIGSLTLKNRWIHSSTYEGLANPDGSCSDALLKLNRQLAAGGVSANIVSFSFIHDTGRSLKGQIGIHNDSMIPGLSRLAETIKKENCRAFIQIAHAGCHAVKRFSHAEPMGPSHIVTKKNGEAREMTKTEIAGVIQWFASGARRAREAGFDGVQLHMAHGYLLCSFLSPYYNRRQDEYGGSVEGRARLAVEVIRAVRQETGPDFPILAKLNCDDGLENGMNYELMGQTAAILEAAGLDAVELSGGCGADGAKWPSSRSVNPKTVDEEGYFKEASGAFRANCGLPLILVGGYRSPEGGEKMIAGGVSDFVSISRPLIREPDLINRWAGGDLSRARCVSCNVCRDRLFAEETPGLLCPFAERDAL